MLFRAVVLTDRGRLRDNNEDNFYFAGKTLAEAESTEQFTAELARGSGRSIFAICDGMGGESLGEEAAAIGVSGLATVENRLRADRNLNLEDLLPPYLDSVNEVICERMRQNKGLRMGSTFCAVLLDDLAARTINLGDSRIYLYRDHQLYRLTKDQTHAERMVDIGLLTRSEADRHPERHRLLQHLGLFPEERRLLPFISPHFRLVEGDRLLLCSDGITEMLTDAQLVEFLDQKKQTMEAAAALLQAALAAGGKDNATLILVDIEQVTMAGDRPLIRKMEGIINTPPLLPDLPQNSARTQELSGLAQRLTGRHPPTDTDQAAAVEAEKQGEGGTNKMKKRAGGSGFGTGPEAGLDEQPLGNRRPTSVDSAAADGGVARPTGQLTQADLERFELARQAALARQAQGLRAEKAEKQVGAERAAESLPSPATPPARRQSTTGREKRHSARDDVLNRKPRHHVADGHLVASPRRCSAERAGHPRRQAAVGGARVGPTDGPARSAAGQQRPAAAGARPTSAHNPRPQAPGYQAPPLSQRQAAERRQAAAGGRPRRKKSGLRFLLYLLVAVAFGFALGWLLLHIGQVF